MNHQSKKASLSAFYHVTVDNVSKLIMSMPSKSCALDILPMWLLKENIEVVAKPITSIINVSLSTGIFPSKFREAVVSPLLKKPSLDKEVLKNYRPVSNISYVSKIMEKVVCNQIERSRLMGYKNHFSPLTENTTARKRLFCVLEPTF